MMSFVAVCVLVLAADAAPQALPLWPGTPPGYDDPSKGTPPTLTWFPAPSDTATGAAVVVCPGGGYGGLAITHEGKDIVEWLNARGITAVLLKYRTTEGGKRPGPLYPAPLLDAQRAIRTVRASAAQRGIDPTRIGIWGFSAGGHLASSAATHFDAGKTDAADPVERVSSRPDFAILAYPVISMKAPVTHGGSRQNLLGKDADPKLVEAFCNETQVTADTPPTFLFHTNTDAAVVPENSVLFYLALKKAGVPAELHIYEKGPHGVGLAARDPVLSTWPGRLEAWLKGRGVLTKK